MTKPLCLLLLILAFSSCRQAPMHPLKSPWRPYSKQALEDSVARQKPVVIDFFAEWCPNCHELDKEVFSLPEIQAKLAQVTALRMDVTNQDDPQVQQILQEYEIEGVPTVIFLDSKAREIKDSRVMGPVTPQEFFQALALILLTQETAMKPTSWEKATFAGGCFWCMQPFFDHTKGVKKTTVGYTGGHTANPSYEDVSSGTTGHAESIQIEFDPQEVSYEKLLNIYWHNIDPTQVNGQFADKGTQYRTVIFYHSDEQKRIAEQSRKALGFSGRFDKPIVTQILPASAFYPAEDYHQKYYLKSTGQYNMYHDNSGRPEYEEKIWGKN